MATQLKGEATMTTTETAPVVGSVNMLEKLTEGRQLPDGWDGWAIRTVRPDLSSSHGYRYPFPGQVAEAPGPINESHYGACPSASGDGLCAAGTWEGMASGGVPARTLLLVAYRRSDVLGGSIDEKLRLRRMLVVDLIDGEALLRSAGSSADLSYANLSYANLSSADLSSANLSSADLSSANLRYADLSYANLSYANLSSADLSSANLSSADLSYANLSSANLSSANLSYARVASGDALRDALYDRGKWTVRPDGLIVPTGTA
jgi:hypothetical protein